MKEIFQKNINQNFDLKQRFLECILSGQLSDELDFLLENLCISNFDYDQRLMIQVYFQENSLDEQLHQFYETVKPIKLFYFEQKQYLNQLLEFGKIRKFYEISSDVGEYLLSNKKYSKLNDFITSFDELLRDRINFSTLKLIFYLEEKNSEKVKEILEHEIKSFSKGTRNIQILLKLLEATESLAFDDFRVHAIYLKLKHVLAYLNYIKLMKKENVEFGLMCESPEDYLVLAGAVNTEEANSVLSYIKNKLEIRKLTNFYKKLYTSLTKRNNLNISVIAQNSKTFDDVNYKNDEYSTLNRKKTKSLNPPVYIKLDVEDKLLSYLAVSEEPPEDELFLTFMMSELYTVAEFYLRKFPDSSFLYERVFLFFNLRNYSEVIYLVNSYLNQFELENPESFLYLKALSFELLGNEKQALGCFREVNKINPNYRKVREILLSYE